MLTPEQLAKIRQKEAMMPDALKRNPLTNYYEGYYFITLNTRGEAPILSTIAGQIGGIGENAPHCDYTELGKRVMKMWHEIPNYRPYVTVISAESMPEHFHGLLYMKRHDAQHLGRVVNGFMIGCTHEYWDTLGIPWREMNDHDRASAPTDGHDRASATTDDHDRASATTASHDKSLPQASSANRAKTTRWQDRDHTRSYRGPALFVRGYNDVVPLTPEEVQVKIEYIKKQAEKRLIQGDRHECYAIRRHQRTRSWTPEVAFGAVMADPVLSTKIEEARQLLALRLNDGLDYVGNKELLANVRKLPLICHRADAALFDQQRDAVLNAARSGAVIVSAFISPKERDILKQLMVEQLPVIEIMCNGFADRYKPAGNAFYACGENRLVQISCWTYRYQRETTVSRTMCMVMNQLARVISGQPDDWWKHL